MTGMPWGELCLLRATALFPRLGTSCDDPVSALVELSVAAQYDLDPALAEPLTASSS